MAQPVWTTPAGSLGRIAESVFFQFVVEADDPDGGTVTYNLVAGSLPQGIQVKTDGTIEGTPVTSSVVQGVPTAVSEDVESSFVIRATSEGGIINDRTFELTVTGNDIPQFVTPAGSLGSFYAGDVFDQTLRGDNYLASNNQITSDTNLLTADLSSRRSALELRIEFTDDDPGDTVSISVIDGELPPGVTLLNTGYFAGYIGALEPLPGNPDPGYDATPFDSEPFDFTIVNQNKNFEFTVEITDGKQRNVRTFSIFVISVNTLTADTMQITADTTDTTTDVMPDIVPLIANYPPDGNIGTFRHDNFFAYQFQGLSLSNSTLEYEIVAGDSADLPPGLFFDRLTGWLTGYLPDQGAVENEYSFSITVYNANNNTIVSDPYAYTITIIGDIDNEITWITPTNLGTIDNGAVSLLAIEATSQSNRALFYRLKAGGYPDGVGVYNKLPQGLSLLPSGEIAGRVSFNTFCLDEGRTTFDSDLSTRLAVDPTTWDTKFTFTVEVYSADGLVSTFRTFTVQVIRAFNSPYERLYIQAMPPQGDRDIIANLVQNQDIFNPSFIYRQDDPRFGVSRKVTYTHAFSLDTGTLDEYVTALELNHFRKPLVLGEIKTAKALASDGTVEYEVVYADIVDNGVNKQGESPPQSIKWPVTITIPGEDYPDRLSNTSTGTKVALSSMTSTYLEPARNANMLANICSQMARDWADSGSPGDPRYKSKCHI